MTYPRICRNGHNVSGPVDEEADHGCRECALDRKRRYNTSAKGRRAQVQYRRSAKGKMALRRAEKTPAAKARALQWRRLNRAKLRAWHARWREENPENERAQQRRDYKRSGRETAARRRARRRGLATEPYTRRAIYDRDDGLCHLCGRLVAFELFEIDHIVPIAMDGPDTPANVAVSCRRCNRSKGARLVSVA